VVKSTLGLVRVALKNKATPFKVRSHLALRFSPMLFQEMFATASSILGGFCVTRRAKNMTLDETQP